MHSASTWPSLSSQAARPTPVSRTPRACQRAQHARLRAPRAQPSACPAPSACACHIAIQAYLKLTIQSLVLRYNWPSLSCNTHHHAAIQSSPLQPLSHNTIQYCNTNSALKPPSLQYNFAYCNTMPLQPHPLMSQYNAFLAIQLGNNPNHFLHKFVFSFFIISLFFSIISNSWKNHLKISFFFSFSCILK